MANRLVSFVALIVAARALVALRRSGGRRPSEARTLTPVQTWEGEGGALPESGAQMGPDPALVGANDDDVRRDQVITGIH
jgi:hypothetical protein